MERRITGTGNKTLNGEEIKQQQPPGQISKRANNQNIKYSTYIHNIDRKVKKRK